MAIESLLFCMAVKTVTVFLFARQQVCSNIFHSQVGVGGWVGGVTGTLGPSPGYTPVRHQVFTPQKRPSSHCHKSMVLDMKGKEVEGKIN